MSNSHFGIKGLFSVALTIAGITASMCSANAATIYGGFEDTVHGDYDYNDLVFSLSSSSLTLNSAGTYYSKPSSLTVSGPVGQTGTPFWNNASSDGPKYNIGYCIYGGGACNGGTGLAPADKYLASNNTTATGSANDVTFSVDGRVSANITLTITADNDALGWYSIASPATIHWFNSGGTGTYTFNPGGDFGLVADNNGNAGQNFYSNTSVAGNTADNVSHFAFFANPVAAPEPGTIGLLGSALAGLAVFRVRKKA